ncbi:MAG: hypothetical protein KTR19_05980 [Hyphomicrobiales bacterium]|nr:hypothetical protein [Hyphomicrobiales bacterium]
MIRMTKQDRFNWTGVAILSLVLHALLFAYHATAPLKLVRQGSAHAGGILICSGGALRSLWLGEESEPAKPAPGQLHVKCPVCSAVAAYVLLPDQADEPVTNTDIAQSGLNTGYGAPRRSRLAYSHPARAPPPIV